MTPKARWWLIWTIAIALQWLFIASLFLVKDDLGGRWITMLIGVIVINWTAQKLARNTGHSPPKDWMFFGPVIESETGETPELKAHGFRALQRGEYRHALAAFERVLEKDPMDTDARIARGDAHRLLRQYDEAIGDYTRAYLFDPTKVDALVNRGRVYLEQGQLDSAIKDFTEALERDPNFAQAYAFRGLAFQRKMYLASGSTSDP